MNKIFNIKEEEISLLASQGKNMGEYEILNELSMAIESVPSISKNVCKYIDALCVSVPTLKEPIKSIISNTDGDDPVGALSKMVYGEYLGMQTKLKLVDRVSDMFLGFEMACDVPEIFSKISDLDNFQRVFYCYSILNKFVFDKKECKQRLKEYSEEEIVEAMLIEESITDIVMIVELCKFEGFLRVVHKNISRFRRRVEIIGLIFLSYFTDEGYYSMDDDDAIDGYIRNYQIFRDDRQLMVELIDSDDVIKYIRKIGSTRLLNKLLGTNYEEHSMPFITFEEFKEKNTEDKMDFFQEFLKLTSVSPTHFLSYLEYFKQRFQLTEDEKKVFLEMLDDFYKNNEATLEIIKNKLAKFKILIR